MLQPFAQSKKTRSSFICKALEALLGLGAEVELEQEVKDAEVWSGSDADRETSTSP